MISISKMLSASCIVPVVLIGFHALFVFSEVNAQGRGRLYRPPSKPTEIPSPLRNSSAPRQTEGPFRSTPTRWPNDKFELFFGESRSKDTNRFSPLRSQLSTYPLFIPNAENHVVRPALISLLPTDNISFRSVFPKATLNAQARRDIAEINQLREFVDSRLSSPESKYFSLESKEGPKEFLSKIEECEGANVLVVPAHAIFVKGEQYLCCPNGEKIATQLVIDRALSLDLVPLIVSCHSKTFQTDKITIDQAVSACYSAFHSASYASVSVNEFAHEIKMTLDASTTSTWKIEVLRAAGSITIGLLIIELVDDDDETEAPRDVDEESDSAQQSSAESPNSEVRSKDSGRHWLGMFIGIGALCIIGGIITFLVSSSKEGSQ